MDDASERLLGAIQEFEAVAEAITPDEAARSLDDATLQAFWQQWPHVSSWSGSLWRRLNEDLADAAAPADHSDIHEVGGEGG